MDKTMFLSTIQELEAEIKTLQNKKHDADQEYFKAVDQRDKLVKEIEDLKKEHVVEKQIQCDLTDKTSDVMREYHEAKKEVDDLYAGLEDEKKVLENDKRAVQETVTSIKWEKEAATKTKDNLFQKELEIDKRMVDIKAKEHELRSLESSITTRRSETAKLYTDTRDKNLQADAKLSDVFTKTEYAANLLERAKAKLTDADNRIAILELEKQGIEEARVKLEIKEKTLDAKLDNVTQQEVELEKKNKGLERAYDALDVRDKELQVKSLRLEKLIKEKGLSEELSKLEKELSV